MSKRTKSPNSKNESGNATSDKSKVPKKIPQSSSKEVFNISCFDNFINISDFLQLINLLLFLNTLCY